MNSNTFKNMYEAAVAAGKNGYDAIMKHGANNVTDPKTGRAWMTYVGAREGAGYMGQPQTHEIAAAEVTKFHKGF